MRKKIILIAAVGLVIFSVWFFSTKLFAQRGNIYLSLKLFNQVLGLVQQNYVHKVDGQELIELSIKGMLHSLDPYSDYLNPTDYEMLRSHTAGEFGGLGIRIAIVDGVLTVVSPIERTPAYDAGIQSGDRIISIDNESTKEITLDDAVKKLRGTPGTKVTITIQREELEEPFDCTITRAIIKIPAIPYAGIIEGEIGYVRLSNFSRVARRELEAAIDSLRNLGARKFIFDLRSNPGGLLQEGIEVSDLFLESGKSIVVTKGRIPQSSREFRAVDMEKTDYPLIVLVDRGSASASEIVAGALQDWEKAFVIGDTTFGKGSVQTLHPLEGGGALKLTTAYWYTPSGRCIDIHAAKKDSLEKNRAFHTLGPHRFKVYGWGGIVPDLIVEYLKLSSLGAELNRDPQLNRLFIDYAIRYARHHPDLTWDFDITEDMFEEYRALLKKKTEFTDAQFDSTKEFIAQRLKSEIAYQLWKEKGAYELGRIPYDPLIKRAINLLKNCKSTEEIFRFVKG